jgi:hypothetical protein
LKTMLARMTRMNVVRAAERNNVFFFIKGNLLNKGG